MDFIPDDQYFKYNTDTLISIRKCYNLEKTEQMAKAVDILDEWVKQQVHFGKKDFSREHLERIIIMLKGSIERAKGQLEKMCTNRTLLPHFFEKFDAKKDFKDIKNYHASAFLPRLTEEHQRIHLIKLMPTEYSKQAFFIMYCYNILMLEYMKAHDYNDGLITVVDLRDLNIVDFVTCINLTDLKHMVTIALGGFATRAKKFVLISTSNAIELLMKILRQLLPEKLAKRMFVVKDLKGLHEQVPGDLLPKDYGGNEKSLSDLHDEFQEAMSSKQNLEHLKEMRQARTNESLRTTSKISDELLGISGSFRTLSFD